MNVAKLVKRAKRGDKDALVQLVMHEKNNYYRLAYTYIKNEHDALDALENMIVILYEKIDQLKNPDVFYSWSKTILVNECRALLKRRNRISFLEEEDFFEKTVDPFDHVHSQLEIEDYLQSLSHVQREAVQLKYLLDYDYETIALLTNVSIGTAKTRVFHAMKKLQKHYGKEHPNEFL
ncbi:MAG: sigma-70 family RNA polymerase sigma factor [Solibacillus sp.]|uniref:sigma-70 family RNA polymerase sigma factor n=1 Tax=unclassified Solibacillus TaxID=2637870 RepID=UPI0030FB093E